MSKFTINKLNIAQAFFLLFLVSLFFPIRYVFPTKEAFQTGAYSDFTSISLYLSDIFLFLTALFIFSPRGIGEWKVAKGQWAVVVFLFWLNIALLSHFLTLIGLNCWFFAKYLELAVSYGTAYCLFTKTSIKALFIRIFVIFSSLESILALWQFQIQSSVGHGLGKLGEQVLSPTLQGEAKIVSGGTTFIRGYGTFPHPNLLSAFLVAGVLFSIYLFLTTKDYRLKTIYSLAIALNCLGLTVTFSRAGFLALGAGLLIFFFYSFQTANQESKKQIYTSAVVVLVCLMLSFVVFKPYLATRATITDDAALERIFYAKLGWQMTKQHPIFGVGIGENVLHMQQYSPIRLWPWQIQPVHNYFLLAAAELGIPGALILIWVFLSHLFGLIKKIKSNFSPYLLSLFCILLSFLLLMQFDHYFYTLQQTQMLLWIILGIIAAEIKNPQAGDSSKN